MVGWNYEARNYIFLFGTLNIWYSSTLFIKIISFSMCNL